jgi:hypothetical protein
VDIGDLQEGNGWSLFCSMKHVITFSYKETLLLKYGYQANGFVVRVWIAVSKLVVLAGMAQYTFSGILTWTWQIALLLDCDGCTFLGCKWCV